MQFQNPQRRSYCQQRIRNNKNIDQQNIQIIGSQEYLQNYTYLEFSIFPQLFQKYLIQLNIDELKSILNSYVGVLFEFCPQLVQYSNIPELNAMGIQFMLINQKMQQKLIKNYKQIKLGIKKLNSLSNIQHSNYLSQLDFLQKNILLSKSSQYQIIISLINQQKLTSNVFHLIYLTINQIILKNGLFRLFDCQLPLFVFYLSAYLKQKQEETYDNSKQQCQFRILYIRFLWKIMPYYVDLQFLNQSINKNKTKLCYLTQTALSPNKYVQYWSYLQVIQNIQEQFIKYAYLSNNLNIISDNTLSKTLTQLRQILDLDKKKELNSKSNLPTSLFIEKINKIFTNTKIQQLHKNLIIQENISMDKINRNKYNNHLRSNDSQQERIKFIKNDRMFIRDYLLLKHQIQSFQVQSSDAVYQQFQKWVNSINLNIFQILIGSEQQVIKSLNLIEAKSVTILNLNDQLQQKLKLTCLQRVVILQESKRNLLKSNLYTILLTIRILHLIYTSQSHIIVFQFIQQTFCSTIELFNLPSLEIVEYFISTINLWFSTVGDNTKVQDLERFYSSIIRYYSKINVRITQQQMNYVQNIIMLCQLVKSLNLTHKFLINKDKHSNQHVDVQKTTKLNIQQAHEAINKSIQDIVKANKTNIHNLLLINLIQPLQSYLSILVPYQLLNFFKQSNQSDQIDLQISPKIEFNKILRFYNKKTIFNNINTQSNQLLRIYIDFLYTNLIGKQYKSQEKQSLELQITNILQQSLLKQLKQSQIFQILKCLKKRYEQLIELRNKNIKQSNIIDQKIQSRTKIMQSNINQPINIDQTHLQSRIKSLLLIPNLNPLLLLLQTTQILIKSKQQLTNIISQFHIHQFLFFKQNLLKKCDQINNRINNYIKDCLGICLKGKVRLFKCTGEIMVYKFQGYLNNTQYQQDTIKQYRRIQLLYDSKIKQLLAQIECTIEVCIVSLAAMFSMKFQLQSILDRQANLTNINSLAGLSILRCLSVLSLCSPSTLSLNYPYLQTIFSSLISQKPSYAIQFTPLPITYNLMKQLSFIGSIQYLQFLYQYFPFHVQNQQDEKILFHLSKEIVGDQRNFQFLTQHQIIKSRFVKLINYLDYLSRNL